LLAALLTQALCNRHQGEGFEEASHPQFGRVMLRIEVAFDGRKLGRWRQ
jgi:hypothetical protein